MTTNAGVEPVGLSEEQTAVRRYGQMVAEEMLQRRELGALGMAPLLRLLELARVAEEDDTPRSRSGGERVHQTQLARLVDDQNIYNSGLWRPEPSGASEYLNGPVGQCRERRAALHEVFNRPFLGFLPVLDLVATAHCQLFEACGLNHLLEQVSDHSVADRGYAHPFPVFDQLADHSRADIRLSSAGWTLDRQYAAIQL